MTSAYGLPDIVSISSAITQWAAIGWYSVRVPAGHANVHSANCWRRPSLRSPVVGADRRLREPALHRQQLQHGDAVLAVVAEPRQVSSDRCGQCDAAVGEVRQQRHGDDGLGCREDHEPRVGGCRSERCTGDDLAVQSDRELRGLRVSLVDLGLDADLKGVDCVAVEHAS